MSFKELLPKKTSGRSPLASSRDFCSDQSASPAYCQLILTLVSFSICWNMAFSSKSAMLAPFTYRKVSSTCSLTMGRPVSLKFSSGVDAALEVEASPLPELSAAPLELLLPPPPPQPASMEAARVRQSRALPTLVHLFLMFTSPCNWIF